MALNGAEVAAPGQRPGIIILARLHAPA